MYGFITFVVSTVILILAIRLKPRPVSGPCWHLGALMFCIGGYWFWFVIRVDVSAEGNPWHHVSRADIFILSLATTYLWAALVLTPGSGLGWLFFVLSSAPAPRCSAPCSGPSLPMFFFKPAAAFQKKVTQGRWFVGESAGSG